MKPSAGILIYRKREGQLEVLIAHHGGPIWTKKDDGAWSIFKGLLEPGEDPLAAAKREFSEETGKNAPHGTLLELEPVHRTDGKVIYAWAAEADYDQESIVCNTFQMEWPPKSGRIGEWPENDRAEWFDLETARRKLHSGQSAFIDQLEQRVQLSEADDSA
ncbi:MAG TPA: NUDIX domain-containing protein [Candidatus Limnocylindrales bacterium]|nr:NUDIX domain-containing protein [Candidatus Limnocylindrales bacterium]